MITSEKIYPSNKIYVAKSPIHGLGVFANEDIKKGELIEATPLVFTGIKVLKMSKFRETGLTVLLDYLFSYLKNGEVVDQVIALGCASLYNHSNTPNANWKLNEDINVFEFYSTRDIQKDEEICTYYGPESYWTTRDLIKQFNNEKTE